jgi:DNA-binding transcriptional MerR regulator
MQHQTMPMSKKKFRIGELAKELKVKKFVIRFWEKEFDLKSERSEGGQRFYTQDDFKTFNTIKVLLYSQGYTIAGAKTKLNEVVHQTSQPETQVMAEQTTQTITAATKIIEVDETKKDVLLEKLNHIKGQLSKFKQLLE